MSELHLETIAARLAARAPRAQGDAAALGPTRAPYHPNDAVEEKRAAVAVIVRERLRDVGPELLFIKRADKESDPWSGHMAFPGGRQDARDADLLATALRETREEIGLVLDAQRLLGRLDALGAVARGGRVPLAITPYVFSIGDADPVLVPKIDEVAEVHWAALAPLMRGEAGAVYPYVHEGAKMELPGYRVGERIVWGMTYRMLGELFSALRG